MVTNLPLLVQKLRRGWNILCNVFLQLIIFLYHLIFIYMNHIIWCILHKLYHKYYIRYNSRVTIFKYKIKGEVGVAHSLTVGHAARVDLDLQVFPDLWDFFFRPEFSKIHLEVALIFLMLLCMLVKLRPDELFFMKIIFICIPLTALPRQLPF